MRIAVFTYNFPHRKTQEFLFRLFVNGFNVRLVLAANKVDLKISKPTVRMKPVFSALLEPAAICKKIGWRYEVVDHNSSHCADLIKEESIDLGIVAGARILKPPTLFAPNLGILNFHPGLLPDVRGLDSFQWAVFHNKAIGVTAHLIDEHIDSGRIVCKEEVDLYPEDNVIDVTLRMQEIETRMLSRAVTKINQAHQVNEFPLLKKGPYNRKMPADLEVLIKEKFQKRIEALKG